MSLYVQALVGSLYHKVLSTCFDENFDFEYIWQEFLQNKILSAKLSSNGSIFNTYFK